MKAALRGVDEIYATPSSAPNSREAAFAAIFKDGSVVARGYKDWSGDWNQGQMLLVWVCMIYSIYPTLTEVLKDGSVATWVCKEYSGGLIDVQMALLGGNKIYLTVPVFAALLKGRSVWRCGRMWSGRICLAAIYMIYNTISSLATVLNDGSVLRWNLSDYGSYITSMQTALLGVNNISSTDQINFALR